MADYIAKPIEPLHMAESLCGIAFSTTNESGSRDEGYGGRKLRCSLYALESRFQFEQEEVVRRIKFLEGSTTNVQVRSSSALSKQDSRA